MRDPMGPPFHVNLIRGQRFVQISMACKGINGQARMIPVDWVHAPLPAKPKSTAAQEQLDAYHKEVKVRRLSAVGAGRIKNLRTWLDEHSAQEQMLWAVVDGSYTNRTVFQSLPPKTILVGRVRSDAHLYYLPDQRAAKGRNRVYGEEAPTPEKLLKDDTIPWQILPVFFGGENREIKFKQLTPLRWRVAGQKHTLQLIVIQPTKYQLSKRGKKHYRQPAYLICTDPLATPHDIIQHYLWRWDIETNHRDEKTILGVGDAKVRTEQAVQNVTGCAVAAYAMLLIAADQCEKQNKNWQQLPPPKWHPKRKRRPTTTRLIQNLRHEICARSIHFSGFVAKEQQHTKPQKTKINLQSAILYASKHS
jgi:hypothetical protein